MAHRRRAFVAHCALSYDRVSWLLSEYELGGKPLPAPGALSMLEDGRRGQG